MSHRSLNPNPDLLAVAHDWVFAVAQQRISLVLISPRAATVDLIEPAKTTACHFEFECHFASPVRVFRSRHWPNCTHSIGNSQELYVQL